MRVDIDTIEARIKRDPAVCAQQLALTQADLRSARHKVGSSPSWRNHYQAQVEDLEHNERVWLHLVAVANAKQRLREEVEKL